MKKLMGAILVALTLAMASCEKDDNSFVIVDRFPVDMGCRYQFVAPAGCDYVVVEYYTHNRQAAITIHDKGFVSQSKFGMAHNRQIFSADSVRMLFVPTAKSDAKRELWYRRGDKKEFNPIGIVGDNIDNSQYETVQVEEGSDWNTWNHYVIDKRQVDMAKVVVE